MTHRELDQGIKERMWQINNWGSTCLKDEVDRMHDQLEKVRGALVMRVCFRAVCTFDLSLMTLVECEWDEDRAVFLLMRARNQRV